MFVKHGDGKIVSVLKDEEELTDEQKQAVKDASRQMTKQSNDDADTSEVKKSGR